MELDALMLSRIQFGFYHFVPHYFSCDHDRPGQLFGGA